MFSCKACIPFFIFVIFLHSCKDIPTKIERDNPNDPESVGFELDPTQSFSTEILENKAIKISWEDSSTAPTHYVLRKKPGASDEYQILDTLGSENKNFIDESGEITRDTEYEIHSIRVQKNDSIITSDRVTSGINFGALQTQNMSYNPDTTAIEFEWEFESKWPFIGVAYYIDYDVVNETSLDTLYNLKSYTTPEFEKDFAERYYQIKFFVSEEDIEKGNIYQLISGAYYGWMEFLPEITNLEIINEGKVIITWEDNSNFEDGFRILRSQGPSRVSAPEPVVIAEIGPNITSFSDTLDPLKGYVRTEFGGESLHKTYYGIQAYKNDTKTGVSGYEIKLDLGRPTLTLNSATNNSITLTWGINSSELVKNFILEKKINNGGFSVYKTVDANVTQFIDTQIDTSNTYSYRVKSLTSRYSESVTIGL